MSQLRLIFLVLLTALFVVGCGGGGSSSTSSSGEVEGLNTPSRVSIVDAES